jgi:CheY-like chemotaxis protein
MFDGMNLLAGLRVLVIDDVAFSLTIVSRMLRELGAEEVLTAQGGVEAVKSLQSREARDIDLVILDIDMPGIDGITILKMIRGGRTEAEKSLPVAILSSVSQEKSVRAAFELGIGAYVMKPISKSALGARLAKVVGHRMESRRLPA